MNENIKILSPKEQTKETLYKMKIRFKADVGIKSLNSLLETCGFHEKPIAKDNICIYLEQYVSFIPDNETLKTYADILKQQYETDEIQLTAARFDGYEYLYAITVNDTNTQKKND